MTEESTEGSIMSDEMAAARVAEGLDPVLGGTSIAERAPALTYCARSGSCRV